MFKKVVIGAGAVFLLVLAVGAYVLFVIVPPRVGASMNAVVDPGPYAVGEPAQTLHETLFVADLHGDSLLWGRDLLARASWGHIDLPRLREGNVALQAFTVVTKVPAGINIESNSADARDQITLLAVSLRWPRDTWTSLRARALHQAELLHEASERSGNTLRVIKSREDLETFERDRAERPELVAGLLGVEGAHCLEGELDNVDVLFDAGFRMIGLTHFFDNELGGSAHGIDKGGITEFGRAAVRRMEELGIVVDIAHASPALIDDVLAMATKPLLVSHTGVQGTCDNRRNLSDEHIQAIAKNGGIIGIGLWDTAVCGNDAAATARAMKYVAELVGVEHVALGSDNDGAVTTPFDVSGFGLITEALQAEGFGDEDLAKMMGGNVREFFKKALPAVDTPEA
jgi:membrane dipeptidase